MDLSDLVDNILETVLEPTVLSDHPGTQSRITRSEVWNLLEDWEKDLRSEILEEMGVA